MRDSRTYRAARRNLFKLTRRHNKTFQWHQMFSAENTMHADVPPVQEVLRALAR